jgi:hypothetical protein
MTTHLTMEFLCRALALAPFVDRGLSSFTNKFKFQSQGKVIYRTIFRVDFFFFSSFYIVCSELLNFTIFRLSWQ